MKVSLFLLSSVACLSFVSLILMMGMLNTSVSISSPGNGFFDFGQTSEVPNGHSYLSLPHGWTKEQQYLQHLPYPENKVWRNESITLGFLYNNELDVLKKQLDMALKWDQVYKELFEFLIIDDGSQIQPARLILDPQYNYQDHLKIRVVTILRDIPWNIGGARNLLAYTSNTRFFLQMDIDHYFDYQGIRDIAEYFDDYLYPSPFPNLSLIRFQRGISKTGESMLAPCCIMVSVELYWYVGGCDEDFVGHYGKTDPHFYRRAMYSKVPSKTFERSMIKMLPKASKGPKRIRDSSENAKLFGWKKRGLIPWSNLYLRFPWRYENSSGALGTN